MPIPSKLLFAGSLVVFSSLRAIGAQQRPSAVLLDGNRVELNEPMTLITGLQPLPDGRVVAVDAIEKAIRIVDFSTGTVTQIGREGQGPDEFVSPRTALPWSGDTVLVYDGSGRSFLRVAPDGTLAGEIPIPGSLYMMRGVTPPRWAADRTIYFEVEPLDFLRDESAPRRGLIVRWTPGTEQLDSVAALMTYEPGRPTRRAAHFRRHDGWGVAEGGRIGIARALDYRVQWHEPGRPPLIGATVAFRPVPVTAREREAVEEAVRAGPRPTSTMTGGSRGSGSSTRETVRSPGPAAHFPDTKPPFEARDRLGRPGVFAAPEGELWVTRSRAWNDSIPVVDVFDDRSSLVRRFELPPSTRLLYVGREAVYLARRDADDLEWLIRVDR